ncbi:hypothetical protein XELAEV_18005524mg [Xenopus laevis]|uniref:Uncharacterized protein n=1 Tax=Xenopus laevis TaxID=8355 RepID=A0A974DXS8_XENLA|nr:hypothetical protein XELAEV_18005524mg [Xenopus laevis]
MMCGICNAADLCMPPTCSSTLAKGHSMEVIYETKADFLYQTNLNSWLILKLFLDLKLVLVEASPHPLHTPTHLSQYTSVFIQDFNTFFNPVC